MMNQDFVHLRVHSEYSLKDSTIRIFDKDRENLISTCQKFHQSAVALTDEVNLFATVAFYKHAITQGVKPIIGAELWVKVDNRLVLMPFYAMNKKGYCQLCHLISTAWINRKDDHALAVVEFAQLAENCDSLMALCGGVEGVLAPLALKNPSVVEAELRRWQAIFKDRFYLEIHRMGIANEESWIQSAVSLSQQHQLPLVATNKACFLSELDFYAHEARVSIYRRTQLGSDDLEGLYSTKQYLRSSVEMATLFADLPVAIENTVLIAKRCNVEGILGEVKMPDFAIEGDDLVGYFQTVAQQGLEERLAFSDIRDEQQRAIYQKRLQTEMQTIEKMQYIGYFLIVADFIQWAKKQAIPVGPGRGSGAGSLVAYALKITDVDPIRFDLIFERFLNIERQSMPDFDIDFCVNGREKVIDYVVQKYGASQVAQIITFGTLSAKAVVRDVARVLGFPYAVGDMVSKLIPNELDITIEKSFELSKEFKLAYSSDEEVREVVDLAMQLEGLVRNVGKHAGGIVIAPSNIQDFCPIYMDSEAGSKVTQFHKDALEDIGLVKFDFLGLKNLTTMDHALKWINAAKTDKQNQPSFSLQDINYTDPNVYKMLSEGSVIGVFQLESSGIRKYTMQLKPTTIDHLTDMLALYRPGPLNSGMVDKYMKHREGKEQEPLKDDSLEPILESTNGVIIYQEQVMKIAQQLAGFTLGNADILRQAMGKKNHEKMAKMKISFLQGAEKNGINAHIANEIFEQMEKFAEYGFNKSHSVAYAIVSFQTAYLKYHYPAAYMAAMMSSDSSSQERLYELKQHCEFLGLSVKVVDINQSQHHFVPINDREIIWSLSALKGVGEGIAESITSERFENGIYEDFFDFCQRVGKRHVLSKGVLEKLIYSGAFDSLHADRDQLLANIERGISYMQEVISSASIGQGDLFSTVSSKECHTPEYLPANTRLSLLTLLSYEKHITGIYLHQSPYHIFYQEVKNYDVISITQFRQIKEQDREANYTRKPTYLVLGEIERLRTSRKMQKGKKTNGTDGSKTKHSAEEEKLRVTMEMRVGDGSNSIECVIRDEKLQNLMYHNKWFTKHLLLVFVGSLKYDEITHSNSLEVSHVLSMAQLRQRLLDKIIFDTTKDNISILQNTLYDLSLLGKEINNSQSQVDDLAIDGSNHSPQSEHISLAKLEMRIKEHKGEMTFISSQVVQLNDDRMASLLAANNLSVSVQRKVHVDAYNDL